MYFPQITVKLNSSMFDSLLKVRASDNIPMIVVGVRWLVLWLSWLGFSLVVIVERRSVVRGMTESKGREGRQRRVRGTKKNDLLPTAAAYIPP